MDSGILHVYCLDGSTAKKFQIEVPGAHKYCVGKLRTYLLSERRIPVQCQTLFVRDPNTGMFEHLQNDERPLGDLQGGKTLHLYVKKSAQTATLENTRQSDFDVWYEKFKALKIDANYQAPAQAAPAPITRQRPGDNQPQPTVRQSVNGGGDVRGSLPPNRAPKPPQVKPAHRPQTRPPQGQQQQQQQQRGNVHKHNTQSEHCLKCYHDDGDYQLSTYYCYHCPPQMCVFCDVCVAAVHEHIEGHDLEMIDRGDIPDRGAGGDNDHLYSVIRDETYTERYERPLPSAADTIYQMQHEAEDVEVKWKCTVCTLLNLPHRPKCTMCESDRPGDYIIPDWYVPTQEEQQIIETLAALQEPAAAGKLRWKCVACTFDNLPNRPSCEQCTTERPDDFEIPADYVPEPAELQFIMGDAASRMQLDQILEAERRQELQQRAENREAHLATDNQPIIENDETFDCPICYTECEPGDGVVLRECLHMFCKDCMRGHIESSENPEVKCPYIDDDYHCDEVMQEREIREIAGEFYPKLLEKSLQMAESQAANSYHCKTLNCVGWCIYEEDVNFFQCPTCGVKNCLTCQAIHEGQNCKQYQDELKLKAANDEDAKQTQEEINRLLREGEAMNCPHCKIVIMKKTGCDWLQCSVCKTEICWVTKQARWGPKGAGDTSGGCKCRVNGPCHPNCGNCH